MFGKKRKGKKCNAMKHTKGTLYIYIYDSLRIFMRQLCLSIKIKSTVGERTDANELKARDAFDFYLLLRAMIAAPRRVR